MDMEIMRMKARKEVEMSHKAQMEDKQSLLEKTSHEAEEMKWSLEYMKAEHENMKNEYEKEKISNKAKIRDELDVVLKTNENL